MGFDRRSTSSWNAWRQKESSHPCHGVNGPRPLLPFVKQNGTVRICGDFRVTVNPQLKVDQYPLPLIDDNFASLAGGQKFSKIDLRSAYTQMEMTDLLKPMLTLNTHRRLFRLNRLPFGIASAPAVWRRAIDTVLSGLQKTRCIIDDIILTGADDEHFRNLEAVFARLQAAGLQVNIEKCLFFQDRIEHCGHEVSKDELWKLQTKGQAIVDSPQPENVTQLRSFIGLLNYYQRFLPDLSTTLHLLNKLLHNGIKFVWSADCQAAFQKVKNLIASDHCNGNRVGVRGQRGRSGRFRDVKRCVVTVDRTRVSGISLLRHNR